MPITRTPNGPFDRIVSGTGFTESVKPKEFAAGSIQFPNGSLTSATFSFRVRNDASNWHIPVDAAGNEKGQALALATNRWFEIPAECFEADEFTVLMASSEAATRTVKVFLKS